MGTKNIHQTCAFKPILLVADTNAGCPFSFDPPNFTDSNITVQEILRRHDVHWGHCSDLGTSAPPTCCNDITYGTPYATTWFDRTAICGGGRVVALNVNSHFVCGTDE